MPYLTDENEIKETINELSKYPILWLDTEIADWDNPVRKRLSLVQVSGNPEDSTGEEVYLLDLLDKEHLIHYFINKIMVNEAIEKVFHNAAFDVQYLGGKYHVRNITCTFEIAKKISLEKLGTPNRKLKTLAEYLCKFQVVEQEQGSDWSQRPLTSQQIKYATMDVVFLTHVHWELLRKSGQPDEGIFVSKKPRNESKNDSIENLGLTSISSELEREHQPVSVKKQSPVFQPLTIQNIKLGLECPRLLYLVYNRGGEAYFYRDSLSSQTDEKFNQLINKLTDNLQSNPDFLAIFSDTNSLDQELISSKLRQKFYETEVYPYMVRPLSQNEKTPELEQINILLNTWTLFQKFIHIWVEILLSNRNYLKTENLISQSIIESKFLESSIECQNQTQIIKGNLPNLIYHIQEKSLVIIDPNFREFINSEIQLAEVGLLIYLLRENSKLEVQKVDYWLLNCETAPQKLTYSIKDVENSYNNIVTNTIPQLQQWLTWEEKSENSPPKTDYPQLCNICPQKIECQVLFESKNFPTSPVIKLPNPEPIQPPPPIGDKVGKDLISVFNSFGTPVDYHGAIVAPSFVRVKVKPHRGVTFRKIKNLSEDLQIQIGFDTPPLIQNQAGYVSVDIPREDPQIAFFEQYLSPSSSKFNPVKDEFKIALGIDIEGNLIEADLSDSNSCHFLVGGTTGSGKSEFLRSVLLSLLIRHDPENLKIVLVDPKRVTFPQFERIPWLYKPIIKEEELAISLMEELVEEMERRYQILEANKCPDLTIYNQKIGHKQNKVIPRIVCIFDEYADFMAEKGTRQALEQNIKRLGAKARAAGINLIIATQRPDANVVTPLIRSNLPGRIALKTASEADSSIILGGKQNNAAYLLGKGDLLYLKNGQLNRLQSLFLQHFSFT
jgi:S-DNA-T family DNA segregation ATPase FtsK/SpoIIIE